MLPYYLLIGASLASGTLPLQRPRYRWGYLLTMGLACWLLASLRYVTGFDYRFYESAFQSIAVNGLSGADWSEPGYLLLNLAVSLLWNDYRGFLFVFHFPLTALVFAWIGRFSPAPWLSVFLFLTLQYFALSMNFLRQALADLTVSEDGVFTGGGTGDGYRYKSTYAEPSSIEHNADGTIVVRFSQNKYYTIFPVGQVPPNYASIANSEMVNLQYSYFDGGVMEIVYYADPGSLG